MVESIGWWSRLRSSFGSVLFGGILLLAAFPLLFWNEGRAVKTAKSLEEGARLVVTIDANQVDSTHESALVHTSGEARPVQPLVDSQLGISERAIQLKRTVEMYQWKEDTDTETRETADGKKEQITTYTYKKVWAKEPIDSAKFHEAQVPSNPTGFPFGSETQWNDEVRLGAFRLNDGQVKQIGNSIKLPLTAELLAAIPSPLGDIATIQEGRIYLRASELERVLKPVPRTDTSVTSNQLSGEAGHSTQDAEVDELIKGVGDEQRDVVRPDDSNSSSRKPASDPEVESLIEGVNDASDPSAADQDAEDQDAAMPDAAPANEPTIGDVRVTIEIIRPQEISLIAQQSGESFQPYQTKAGRQLSMLRMGTVSAESMFEQAISGNRFLTWVLRVVGFIVMFLGVLLVFRPLSVVADVVPMIGGLLQLGVALVALLIAAPLALITIAVAWIVFRPLFALALLALAIGIVVLIVFLVRKMQGQEDPTQHLPVT